MLKYKLNFRDTFPAAAVVKEGSSGLGMLPVELFLEMLCIERKRTERSGRKFVLMLLDPGALLQAGAAITETLPMTPITRKHLLTASLADPTNVARIEMKQIDFARAAPRRCPRE